MITAVEALNKKPENSPELIRWALQLLPGPARDYPLEIITGTLALYLAVIGRYSKAADVAERCMPVDWRFASSTEGFTRVIEQTRGNHDGLHALGISMAGLGRPGESQLAFELALEAVREG